MARSGNFTIIQGLRGLAALWVVLFHLQKREAITGLTDRLPSWLSYGVFGYGSTGVAVFFVLSGFVIAHSLENKSMSAAEFGRFVLRRSVRLDPPYWASIALVVVVGAFVAAAHGRIAHLPTFWQVAAHLTYTQGLLGIPELQVVYWTLTYEIQFYLVFATAMMLHRRAFWALYALALVAAIEGRDWAPHGLFVNLWHGFFLGVLAYRAGYLRERPWPLLALAALALVCQRGGGFATPCAVTALLLFAAARTDQLGSSLSAAPWQWLGMISYSLYLVHGPMFELFSGAWRRVAGRGLVADTGALVVLVSACLTGAALFYMAFERPSHRLAKMLSKKGAGPLSNSEILLDYDKPGSASTARAASIG